MPRFEVICYAVNVIIYQLATLYTILFTDHNLKYC